MLVRNSGIGVIQIWAADLLLGSRNLQHSKEVLPNPALKCRRGQKNVLQEPLRSTVC